MTAGFEVHVSRVTRGQFDVEVAGPGVATRHTVEVPEDLAAALGCDEDGEADLVRTSFGFLLEREPPSSILRRFSLDVIGRYFPEYPNEIRRRLQV